MRRRRVRAGKGVPGGGSRWEGLEEGVGVGAGAAKGDHCANWGGWDVIRPCLTPVIPTGFIPSLCRGAELGGRGRAGRSRVTRCLQASHGPRSPPPPSLRLGKPGVRGSAWLQSLSPGAPPASWCPMGRSDSQLRGAGACNIPISPPASLPLLQSTPSCDSVTDGQSTGAARGPVVRGDPRGTAPPPSPLWPR